MRDSDIDTLSADGAQESDAATGAKPDLLDVVAALFTIPRWQYTDEDGITADVVWLNDAVQVAQDALASPAKTPHEPLDVERLVRAMSSLQWGWLGWTDAAKDDPARKREAYRNVAYKVAAEYDRLAEDEK